MSQRVELTPEELRRLMIQRNRQVVQQSWAVRRRLLELCPDYDEYAATVDKLKTFFPRGQVGLPGRVDPHLGTDVLAYHEMLYLVAKFSSWGQNSTHPVFGRVGEGRPAPGPAGGAAA